MHTQIHNITIGFIVFDVTTISYVKAPHKKTSHDARLTNKFGN